MAPTTTQVRSAFEHLDTAEIETSNLADGIRVTVDESEIGLLYQQIRVRGFNASASRVGDTLVAHIEATEGLGELFG